MDYVNQKEHIEILESKIEELMDIVCDLREQLNSNVPNFEQGERGNELFNAATVNLTGNMKKLGVKQFTAGQVSVIFEHPKYIPDSY